MVCVRAKGYEASLQARRIYRALPDERAARHRFLRVIDESGEDYLYPKTYFAPIELPKAIRRVFQLTS